MSKFEPASNTEKICGICNKNPSKYCCPRCEILYCSLDCYKLEAHADCSETFYRECITNELAGLEADDESKKRMLEILKRMQGDGEDEEFDEEIDSDDEGDVDLHERLQGLDLNNADAVWNALSNDEKNEFKALLNQGDVTSIIPQWEPWWAEKDRKLVQDVNDPDDRLKDCPSLVTVPNISRLTTATPSPSIKYNITNVLASYAFIMRYFNGEIDPVESVVYLLDICVNLEASTNFEEPALAVESVVQKCLQSNLIQTDDTSIKVMKYDTFHLLQGPNELNRNYYCKAALSHLHTIFSEAKTLSKLPKSKENSSNKTNNEDVPTKLPKNEETKDNFTKNFPDHKAEDLPPLDLSKVKKCIKKIEFYLSYADSCSMEFELE